MEEKRSWTHHIKRLILENHHTTIPQKASSRGSPHPVSDGVWKGVSLRASSGLLWGLMSWVWAPLDSGGQLSRCRGLSTAPWGVPVQWSDWPGWWRHST